MVSEKPKRHIYLVVWWADYEGYDAPESAFFDEPKAYTLAAKKNKRSRSRSSRYEVLSVEINDDER